MRLPLIVATALSVASLHASEAVEAPWERHAIDIETGMIWQFRDNTNINYQLVPTQLSWRGPHVFKWDLAGGSTVVVRNQASLITTWVAKGPEDHYFGVSGAPSLEWWSPDSAWSLYLSVGGGVGVINSTDIMGGQGQDFTLNWFIKTGARRQICEDFAIFGGPFFQHLSNGGATTPNPGIDALGVSIGASFSF